VHFSDVLTHAREQAQLSKAALAQQSGISLQHLSNIEAGRRPLTLEVLQKLDQCLHFPTRTLLAVIRCPRTGRPPASPVA
jgi:transcriptional regulator with XRE-family HTH domain